MLIYFFSNSNEALKLEGLFRKSVVIDEERELVTQLSNQNYNYLSTVTDPHLIASTFPFTQTESNASSPASENQ
jgi:hypothetical protein